MVVPQGGMDRAVTTALLTLDLLDNVTLVWLDGLDQSVMLVKDLDSALRVTAPNAFRTVTGKEVYILTILMFI